MLLQMVNIVKEEKPDVFLLCGDVYHTPQPSAAVQTMFTNALVKIHDANPGMTIIVTAGNHDSSSKHDIFRTPWKALNVYTVGSVDTDHLEELIIDIPGKGFVVAVPYVNERNMPKGLYQQLLDEVERRNGQHLPVVLSAHTTVRGCDFTGHENSSEYAVGGIDAYDLDDMGTGYDYLALGHIHHAQFVQGGHHRVRYSGTPLPVSFDESYRHTVSMVEIASHGEEPSVREIEIRTHRPLVTLPTEGTVAWNEAKKLLEHYPDDIEAYIRLNVEVDGELPAEANAEAQLITQGKKCRFCLINAHRQSRQSGEMRMMSVQEFKTQNPIDIAQRYAEDLGMDFDDDLREMFNETLRAVSEDDRK